MLKIAFLLIGPEAFRSRWYVLPILGALLMAVAVLTALDAISGQGGMTYLLVGMLFLVIGVFALVAALVSSDPGERRLGLLRAGLSLLAGGLMMASPFFSSHWVISVLFGVGLIVDGAIRLCVAVVVRIPRWRYSAMYAVAQLAAAVCLLWQWPLPNAGNIILGVALLIGLAGWLLMRMGFMLRTLEEEVAILMLPIFTGRGWHDHAPILIGEDPPRKPDDPPLMLHIWTPVGSANVVSRRPLLDRYIAAVDTDGVLSSGHVSLEMGPDLYISHYPDEEVERSDGDFMRTLAETSVLVRGRFIPSLAAEIADWCPPDVQIRLHRFSPRRLRAFWAGYRQDNSYNISNRNCAVAVAAALEAALEGTLAGRHPWLRLARLMLDPDLWLAAMVRGRAESMTWTPGFVLDYIRVVSRIVERREASWGDRLRGFMAAAGTRRSVPPVSAIDEKAVTP